MSNVALSVLVLISLAFSTLAVFVLLPPALRERRARSRGGRRPGRRRVDADIEEHALAIQRLETAVRQLALGQKELGDISDDAVRHVGVVRFDAFEDMGGRLSFSAALLDGRGDGVVITSINGRQETRCYAKQVRNGTSVHNLSDEEGQAIRRALSGVSGADREVAEAREAHGG